MHLGINVFHDVGVAVVDDTGTPLVIYEETKFTGKKEAYHYPFHSVWQLLKDGHSKFQSVTWPIDIEQVKAGGFADSSFVGLGLDATLRFKHLISTYFEIDRHLEASHHEIHAESVFFASGFETADILIIDGAGEEHSISFFNGNLQSSSPLRLLKSYSASHFSLGHLYGFFTSYLGYSKGSSSPHCGKIMGMSSYGVPRYLPQLLELYYDSDVLKPASHLKTFNYLRETFGPAFHISNEPTQVQSDLAASIQAFLETALFRLIKEFDIYNEHVSKPSNLCLAGGVAMNSVANGKLLAQSEYKDIFVQPASSDCGIAYGAAHYGFRYSQNNMSPVQLTRSRWKHAFWGYNEKANNTEIKGLIDRLQLPLEINEEPNCEKSIAQAIANGKIVAVCNDHQEIGERALGNRSILTLPTSEMRDVVNSRIKHREAWRPFAPIVLDNYMQKMFAVDRPENFMSIVYDVDSEYPDFIQGVVHVDQTARVQTATKDLPHIYNVLKYLETDYKLPPVIMNTSFNINGQSIVRTAYDALITFCSTSIDELYINGSRITRTSPIPIALDQLTSVDRALHPYIADAEQLQLVFYQLEPDQTTESLCKILFAPSVSRMFRDGDKSLSVYSNASVMKHLWRIESLLSEHMNHRMRVQKIDMLLSQKIPSACRRILVLDIPVLPFKTGYTMSSFGNAEYLKSILSISDLLSSADIVVDSEERVYPSSLLSAFLAQ
jgi:carbamoyltransferase